MQTQSTVVKTGNPKNQFASRLTKVPKGPTMGFMVVAHCEDRFSERTDPMKTLLRALPRAQTANDDLHASLSGRHGTPETSTWANEHTDGPAVWRFDRQKLEKIHVVGGFAKSPRDGLPHAVLCNGPLGTGRANDQSRVGPDAVGGSNDRDGQALSPASGEKSSFAYIANQIAVEAIRASAMAPSTSEALDIVGAALIRITYLSKAAEVSHD